MQNPIRYILVNNYEDCKIHIEEAARMATTSEVTDFLRNDQKHGVICHHARGGRRAEVRGDS